VAKLLASMLWHWLALLWLVLWFCSRTWLIRRHGSVSFSIGETGVVWLSGMAKILRLLHLLRQLIPRNPWSIFKAIVAKSATHKKCF
jgi:hypothetical protein